MVRSRLIQARKSKTFRGNLYQNVAGYELGDSVADRNLLSILSEDKLDIQLKLAMVLLLVLMAFRKHFFMCLKPELSVFTQNDATLSTRLDVLILIQSNSTSHMMYGIR